MSSNGRNRTPMPDVAGSVSGLTHDVIELAELQTQLFKLDLKKSTQKTRTCLILAVIAACLLLASLPVGLMALAALLVEQLEWSQSAALGVATLVGLVLAGIFAGAAYGIVRSGLISIQRSRDEFNRNIAWIKSTLKDQGRYRAFTKT
jgi:uncharacterized membrane protein YqjE